MDPKTPTNLDPKLKEVYDRVMGTANPASAPPPQTTPTPVPTVPPSVPQPAADQGLSSSPFPASAPSSPTKIDTGQTSVPPVKPLGSSLPSSQAMAPTSTPTPPPLTKPVVDYAALAAKYATPTPSISTINSTSHPTPVTPSSTTYGMVNNKPTKEKNDQQKEPKSTTGSMKKIMIMAGIPLVLLAYTAIWIFVFKVDILSFLPLPK